MCGREGGVAAVWEGRERVGWAALDSSRREREEEGWEDKPLWDKKKKLYSRHEVPYYLDLDGVR